MEHKIDRISKLPDPIVEHILSFIPMKQTLQLTMLSKGWQKVWALFPIPEFNQFFFTKNLRKVPANENKQGIQRRKEEFNNFVEQTLLSRCEKRLSFNRFKFSTMLDDESDCALVNRWIGYSIECNVKELNLRVLVRFRSYLLPECVLAAKSITELMLYNIKFKSFYSDINLSSLKKLVFYRLKVDDQILRTVIAGCRDVEEMRFDCCSGFKSIQVLGSPKLKTIVLLQNYDLEIVEIMDASNLETLLIRLANPCQINLGQCENLKKFSIYGSVYSHNITDKWLHDVLSRHPLMNWLELRNCCMLERIKISSHHMKSLTFRACRRLVEADIVTPNLRTLEYHGDVISFSLSTASTVSEVTLSLSDDTNLDLEKIEFLAKFNHSKFLTWIITDSEALITTKELRETRPSPLYNVKQLKLKLTSPSTRQIDEVLDDLFWIFPLLEILFMEWGYKETVGNICFKFSYKNPIYEVENPNCCKFLPVLCWRHCLKTIKIENLRGSIKEETLKKYFSDNAEVDFQFL